MLVNCSSIFDSLTGGHFLTGPLCPSESAQATETATRPRPFWSAADRRVQRGQRKIRPVRISFSIPTPGAHPFDVVGFGLNSVDRQ
jgi:hypothetical protein